MSLTAHGASLISVEFAPGTHNCRLFNSHFYFFDDTLFDLSLPPDPHFRSQRVSRDLWDREQRANQQLMALVALWSTSMHCLASWAPFWSGVVEKGKAAKTKWSIALFSITRPLALDVNNKLPRFQGAVFPFAVKTTKRKAISGWRRHQ